jgi:hypothetical protein
VPVEENKMKTFIVKKTMPTYVTWFYEVVAENKKEAYDKFKKGDYKHEPVFGNPEIGQMLDADPKIDVKEKDE